MTPGNSEVTRPRPIYKDFTVLQLALLVFLTDQLTKFLVIQLLNPGQSFPFRGFFRFTHVHNTGSAFGIFQGFNTPLIFVSFIGIIILVFIYRSQPRPSNLLRLSLALQLGGAFGNLIDRLRLGYVTDFIDVGPWPVFNLADASIVVGLILLAWVFTRTSRPHGTQEPAPEGVEVWDTSFDEVDVDAPFRQIDVEEAPPDDTDGVGREPQTEGVEPEHPVEQERL